MKELFKTIKDYPKYKISNLGNVMGTRGTILKGSRAGKNKYLQVYLSADGVRKNFYIHQLMAIVFLNHKPCGYKIVVDHQDNDPLNNNLNNLQLITQRENCSKDKTDVGIHFDKINKKWRASIKIEGKTVQLGSFTSKKEARDAYDNKLKDI